MSEASGSPAAESPALKAGAWQPFTGTGVASFADASAWRTFTFLGVFALATALLAGWALRATWWPVVERAAEAFPETGAGLTNRILTWPEARPRILADAPHLGIAARPNSTDPPGRIADLQLELAPATIRLAGVAGFVELPWPPDFRIPLGRHEAVAAWGAWRRPLLATVVVATAACLFLSWMSLATIYAVPARIAGWLLSRNVTLGGCWRMAAAAQLVGCTVMGLGIFGYALRVLAWPMLAGIFLSHLLVGWVWLAWGVFERRQRLPEERPPKNPFDKMSKDEKQAVTLKTKKKKNPFESKRG